MNVPEDLDSFFTAEAMKQPLPGWLESYSSETGFGNWVHHPFYIGPSRPAGLVVSQIQAKTEAAEQARQKQDWSQYLWLHERPYRVDALADIPTSAEEFWPLVGNAWTDTEFPHQAKAQWLRLFSSVHAHNIMNDEERELLAGLPKQVEVFRGVHGPHGDDGFSWTFSEERAHWFATRFATTPGESRVLRRTVSKAEIVAVLQRRGEEEVLLLPDGARRR